MFKIYLTTRINTKVLSTWTSDLVNEYQKTGKNRWNLLSFRVSEERTNRGKGKTHPVIGCLWTLEIHG